MDNEIKKLEDILREQVYEMEKLLDIKNRRISELENNNSIIGTTPYIYPTVDLCQHHYPNPWYGTVPPNCLRCGKQSSNWITGTVHTGGTYGNQSGNGTITFKTGNED